MIQTVEVTNHLGESLLLELKKPDNSGFFIRGIEGLGPSKSNINVSEGAGTDGATYNSSRLNTRNIVIDLGFYNWGSDSIETIRQRTYRYFPMKRAIKVKVTTDNRIGYFTGYVETNEPNIFSKEQGTQISLICPDPLIYSGTTIQTIFSGVVSLFEFPFENQSLINPMIEMGQVLIETQKNVPYYGDEPVGVVIYAKAYGNVNNLTIYDLTTNESIPLVSSKITSLTGSNIVAGDQIIVSTRPGNKYIHLIRAGVTYNILNAIGVNAKWFLLQPGDNLFTYIAASGGDKLQFMIEHQVAYGGI